MNLTGRQMDIIAQIRREGFLSIDALAAQFAVTPQTIRRDVNQLCDANLLRRRHGGAELMQAIGNVSYDSRRVTNIAAKRRIGAALAAMIPNRASLLFGIGTTPEQVALALGGHEDLTVVTNNLNVALALSGNGSNRVVVAGGALRPADRDVIGPEAVDLFRSYRADFGIYGVGGIDEDGALLDFDHAEAAVREAVRLNCRQSILVADASKFGRLAPAQAGHVSEADVVVMDHAPPGLRQALEGGRARLVVADEEAAA